MNWQKLKSMDCPSCYKPLSKNLLGYICTAGCGFQISTSKFNIISDKLYKRNGRTEPTEEENLSRLNNLGHDEEREDFSGSPHLDY